jgi:hypothetical protein
MHAYFIVNLIGKRKEMSSGTKEKGAHLRFYLFFQVVITFNFKKKKKCSYLVGRLLAHVEDAFSVFDRRARRWTFRGVQIPPKWHVDIQPPTAPQPSPVSIQSRPNPRRPRASVIPLSSSDSSVCVCVRRILKSSLARTHTYITQHRRIDRRHTWTRHPPPPHQRAAWRSTARLRQVGLLWCVCARRLRRIVRISDPRRLDSHSIEHVPPLPPSTIWATHTTARGRAKKSQMPALSSTVQHCARALMLMGLLVPTHLPTYLRLMQLALQAAAAAAPCPCSPSPPPPPPQSSCSSFLPLLPAATRARVGPPLSWEAAGAAALPLLRPPPLSRRRRPRPL